MNPLAKQFHNIFQGREDRYGAWWGEAIAQPVTIELISDHLDGKTGVGIYPATANETCFWGCVDIDVDDIVTTVNLQTALASKGVKAFTERTRKGYHVWVFTENAVPLWVMRRALQAACAAIGYSPKEVNPKQESLAETPIGNYVRLPYFGGNDCFERYIFQYNISQRQATRLSVEQFVAEVETYGFTPQATLIELAALYTPEPKVAVTVDDTVDPIGLSLILNRVDGLSHTIWRDGPLDGSDRSGTLAKLAYRLADQQFTPDEMFAVLKSADRRWGKFYARADGDHQLLKLIERTQ
jgi:hypothetical protein